MSKQVTGIHIFEKLGPINWEDELIAIQALSALTWKKYHGRIELYCNEEHLESLKKWGVDKIYDKIDTEFLKNAPYEVDRNDFWTYCKVFIPSKLEPPFVLVDTDLWITGPLEFDFSNSFIAYHEESFDKNKSYGFYVNFDDFIPEKYIGYFDNTTKPTNVALLLINDMSLVEEWNRIIHEIISEKRKTKLDGSQKTTFLEQWVLPMVAKKMNKKYNTFIPQVYDSTNPNFMDNDLWEPPVSKWDDEEKMKFEKIKHVWGLKKMFSDPFILKEVFGKVLEKIYDFNLDELGLIELKKLIYKTNNFFESRNLTNQNKLSVMYFIPNIITDSVTNILIKRIEFLYDYSKDIEIFVCKIQKSTEKSNLQLENRIIKLVGTKNFFTSKTTDLIYKIKPDLCHYEHSTYDNNFNLLMEKEFEKKDFKFIRSNDCINLESNFGDRIEIGYPKVNNILSLLDDSIEYEFDKSKLPLHVKYQQRILFGLDFNNKHVLCIGDVNKIPKNLVDFFNKMYEINPKVEFHFLNNVDVDSKFGKKLLKKLTPSTKIWIENVDFYEFLQISDLVINFDTTNTTLINETLSYGIPQLVWDFKKVSQNIIEFTNLIGIGNKANIEHDPNFFQNEYYNFYTKVKNTQL